MSSTKEQRHAIWTRLYALPDLCFACNNTNYEFLVDSAPGGGTCLIYKAPGFWCYDMYGYSTRETALAAYNLVPEGWWKQLV